LLSLRILSLRPGLLSYLLLDVPYLTYCDRDRRLHTRSAYVLYSNRISQLAHIEENKEG
jgi:hypothetical protein